MLFLMSNCNISFVSLPNFSFYLGVVNHIICIFFKKYCKFLILLLKNRALCKSVLFFETYHV